MSKVVILRGLPGSGKSTWARRQAGAVICSADDFWLTPGGYKFDGSRIWEAHGWCLRRFVNEVCGRAPLIIVDNTNLRCVNFAPYVCLAEAYGYEVEIRTFENTVEESHARNVHGVPLSTIENMKKGMEPVCFPWVGKQVLTPDRDLE